jgi:hypothetical protein
VELAPLRQASEATRVSGVMMMPARAGEVVVRGRVAAKTESAAMSAVVG